MTLFWIISAAMILAALALLAPTLLRHQKAEVDNTESLNVDIARERLAELTKEKEAGELSDEEFAQAKQDLEVALAQDLESTSKTGVKTIPTGGRSALLISVVLVPLITIPVYFEIGSPQLIEGLPGASMAARHGETGQLPPVDELVEQLRLRMEAEPNNAEGWYLLGRTYMRLQKYAEAVKAYEHVLTLLPEEPAVLMSLADALAMYEGGRIGMRSIDLLEKALSIDPNSVTALWLLGNAAAERGDNPKAIELWKRAFPLVSEEPEAQAELAHRISQAGGTPPPITAAPELPPIMAPAAVAAPAPAAPSENADTDGGVAINVEVALSPELFDRVSDSDTVFVLARAEEGPPMPLAVARHSVGELPLAVTLTDAMAMMPAMKLSSFERVKVSATVSKSGQAGTQAGDMVAADVVVDSTNPPSSVQLLVNQIVE